MRPVTYREKVLLMNEKTASQAGKTETMKKGHNKISGIKNTTLEINHQMCQK